MGPIWSRYDWLVALLERSGSPPECPAPGAAYAYRASRPFDKCPLRPLDRFGKVETL